MGNLVTGQRVRIIKGAGRWKRGKLDAVWHSKGKELYFVVGDDGTWYFKYNASELEVIA